MLLINRMCQFVGLINSNDFNHLTIGTCSYSLLQLVSTSHKYCILKPQLDQHYASLFSAPSLIKVTLTIYNMVQSMINRELANLGVSLTNICLNEGYATQCYQVVELCKNLYSATGHIDL